ncbi:MAG: ROK family protein [Anaerococcus sp.]|nr:ROK family protein [Anaerococcus sp.]
MNILCFDIGGTEIKAMVGQEDGEVFLDNFPSRASIDGKLVVEDIFEKIREVQKTYKIDGIAISTAGMVDSLAGLITYTNDNFKNYMGLSWPKEIDKEFSLKAVVENDVKSAALGEYMRGAGKDYSSTFTLTVGTGIGGALILDGKVYRGASGNAGEIGYMAFESGEFEKLASTTALVKRAGEKYPNRPYNNGKEIFEAIKEGDQDAKDLLDQTIKTLALGISHIMLIANPEAILIGGGISQQEDLFIKPLREKIKSYVPENIYKSTHIRSTNLGNKSGLYGAYHLFLDRFGEN